jgi:hypothetical protein
MLSSAAVDKRMGSRPDASERTCVSACACVFVCVCVCVYEEMESLWPNNRNI